MDGWSEGGVATSVSPKATSPAGRVTPRAPVRPRRSGSGQRRSARHDGCATSSTTASASSSRPTFVTVLNGITCSSSSPSALVSDDDALLELRGAQLVDLREHHHRRRADLREKLEHQEIIGRWADAASR